MPAGLDAEFFRLQRCSLRHPASGIRHLASGIWHLASGIWHLASGIWHLASGIWRRIACWPGFDEAQASVGGGYATTSSAHKMLRYCHAAKRGRYG
ncbi:hypothetical protein O987_19035 [Comamonas testosteroni TK102]|uniref:Uncharacterized protein n=1 Tax=Comamonas testosteroni TK102 TaxID=1392005 RepID=A0A076PM22_COMTE|nr:hypothetical protein O987_19035 [Comamonas testosteroni TK102]